MLQSFKNWITLKWEGRFKYGPVINLGDIMINKYVNGDVHVGVSLIKLISPGTGHWPLTLLEFRYKSGERAAYHISVLGFTFGTIWLPNLDEQGAVAGADYRRTYFIFSCINHQHKQLEEII